jgi:hypothetical protein
MIGRRQLAVVVVIQALVHQNETSLVSATIPSAWVFVVGMVSEALK